MAVPDPLPPVLCHSTINLLAGASGVGKTALIAYMARCLIHGEPLLGHQPQPVPGVCYISTDRRWDDGADHWFKLMGVSDLPHYALTQDRGFDLKRFSQVRAGLHAQVFDEALTKAGAGPGWVVFADPIALFMGGDMNNYVRIMQASLFLRRVVEDRQVCVIGVDHSSKQKGEQDRYVRLQDRIGGSMAKLAYADTQMYLASPDETDSDAYTFLWNPHYAPSQTFSLRKDNRGLFVPVHDLTAVTAPLLTPEEAPIYHEIPEPPQAISTAELVGLFADSSRATLWRRLTSLEAKGYVRQPRRGAWSRATPTAPSTSAPPAPEA